MYITNISDAKASLSHLIKTVQETNESIIIGKAGKPIAILSAFKEDTSPRQLGGSWEGKVEISDDFNEQSEQINNIFYQSAIFPDKQ
ncbi:MAG: type II toxin-antitoxin system prevent-host-death family antitoxin [Methylococcales bacterium]|jgi:prevent-host-death family protein|nr:type II toxin-antitoxin system prevent-host-death family antitoxin [Methylococcales bacterium]MBT7409947.1 type II toxin-antitoxin system prevent-host-death family antitoxin [Methylococcales bacterium]